MFTLERDVLVLQVIGIVCLLVLIGWVPVTTALTAAGFGLTVMAAATVARIRGVTGDSR